MNVMPHLVHYNQDYIYPSQTHSAVVVVDDDDDIPHCPLLLVKKKIHYCQQVVASSFVMTNHYSYLYQFVMKYISLDWSLIVDVVLYIVSRVLPKIVIVSTNPNVLVCTVLYALYGGRVLRCTWILLLLSLMMMMTYYYHYHYYQYLLMHDVCYLEADTNCLSIQAFYHHCFCEGDDDYDAMLTSYEAMFAVVGTHNPLSYFQQ